MPSGRLFFIYMMTNGPLGASLYVGMTETFVEESGNTRTRPFLDSPGGTT
jgi:hypothetical protein